MSENSATESIGRLTKSKHGQVALVVGGLVVLYVAYRFFRNTGGSASAAPDSSGPTGGGADTSGTASTGTGATTGTTNTETPDPFAQLTAWINDVEQKAIAADPGNAATIDATLNDIQNNIPLTQAEQSEWGSILSKFGAPPTPLGTQSDLPLPRQFVYGSAVDESILLNAGVPSSELVPMGSPNINASAIYVGIAGASAPAGAATLEGADRYATRDLVDEFLGISTPTGITGNSLNPTNSNVTASTARQGQPIITQIGVVGRTPITVHPLPTSTGKYQPM